jgi:hypothetical protein
MIGAGPLLIEMGYRFICIGEVSSTLTIAIRNQVNQLQQSLTTA